MLSAFTLIALAEIGDKSQLVCMTLAARHRHWPVILGATTAFLVLNALAVLFGAGVAAWIPERVTAGLVALLFGAFGIHSLYKQDDSEPEDVVEKSGHGIFLTTLLLILVAEFMFKDSIKYTDSYGWGWARWVGLEQKPFDKGMKVCIDCHTPVKNRDWVFTEPASLP